MSAITSISEFCNKNLSGGAWLEYAPASWLSSDSFDPVFLLGNLQPTLLFTVGDDWLRMPVMPGTLSWDQDTAIGEQGPGYTQNVNLILRNVRVEVEPVLEAMELLRWVLKLRDRNGKTWLIGTPEFGLDFTSPGAIGTADSGLNSYRLQFTGLTPRRAVGYVPDPPQPAEVEE